MSRTRKPKKTNELDLLISWMKKLRTAGKSRVILVDKKRAAEQLNFLGIPNTIFIGAYRDFKLVDLLIEFKREAIILCDVNHKSNKKCEKLVEMLKQHKIKVNTRFRKVLFTTEMKSLSGITSYLKKHVNTTQRKSMSETII